MVKMNSIFRLQLDADKLVIAGLELARSIQTPFEYTCRSFISIPELFLKYEDFNLIRLDPYDVMTGLRNGMANWPDSHPIPYGMGYGLF